MSKPKIIAIDDEKAVLTLYKDLLSDIVEVILADDGSEALKILDDSFQLMLLDLNMPNIRGEGISLINSLSESNIPIIVVTGEREPKLDDTGLENVRAILAKPFKINELRELIIKELEL